MSSTLEIESQPTRRSRARREEREVNNQPETVIEGTEDRVSPEAALADSHAQLETSTRQAAEARRQAQEETQRRIAAERKLAEATTARATDRQSVVAAALEAATEAKARAATAKRLARDAGDFDAELQADEDFAQAVYRASNATAELEYLRANPPPKERPQAETQPQTSEAAQRWLDTHPMFFTDEGYKSTAVGAHSAALAAGKPLGSQAYVDHIDAIMTKVYGEGHGQAEGTRRDNGGQQQMSGRRSEASGGAPPSRGDSAGRGAYKEVSPPGLGKILYQTHADGSIARIKFTSDEQADNFREAAQFSRMSVEDYTKEMIDAANEGFGDLRTGDGARFE